MNIHLLSAYPYHPDKNFAAEWLKESSASDPFGIHQICGDPEVADVILFVEHHPPYDPYFFAVLDHPIYKKYKHKVYLYHDSDYVIPLIPGVFPSIELHQYNPAITGGAPYIARLCTNEAILYQEKKPSPAYLFSFVGASRTHSVRKEILSLNHNEAYLKDTSDKNLWELEVKDKKEFEKSYTDISLRSCFVLCPRGIGPNSYRLYETMEMGIAPAIISDGWVPLEGPDWESFSIRIAEKDVERIPQILEERASEAEEMGRKAREAWIRWFSKEVCFHHIAEACCKIHTRRRELNYIRKLQVLMQFLQPFHFKNLLRYIKYNVIKKH